MTRSGQLSVRVKTTRIPRDVDDARLRPALAVPPVGSAAASLGSSTLGAGIKPSLIARQFGISQSEERKVLAMDASGRGKEFHHQM